MLIIFRKIVAVKIRLHSGSEANLVWMTSQITTTMKSKEFYILFRAVCCMVYHSFLPSLYCYKYTTISNVFHDLYLNEVVIVGKLYSESTQ